MRALLSYYHSALRFCVFLSVIHHHGDDQRNVGDRRQEEAKVFHAFRLNKHIEYAVIGYGKQKKRDGSRK